MSKKQARGNQAEKSDSRSATRKQVAQAILKYRPVQNTASLTSKAEPKKTQAQVKG